MACDSFIVQLVTGNKFGSSTSSLNYLVLLYYGVLGYSQGLCAVEHHVPHHAVETTF